MCILYVYVRMYIPIYKHVYICEYIQDGLKYITRTYYRAIPTIVAAGSSPRPVVVMASAAVHNRNF